MRTSTVLRLLALLAAMSLFAAACGGGDDDTAGSTDDGVGTSDGDGPDEDASADDDAAADEASDGDGVGTEEIEDPDDPDDPDDPVAGGVLRFGLNAETGGLNPTTSRLSAPGLTIANAVFDTLAAFDKDGNAVPYLAESFTPNQDFTVWTVKLRAGIEFHDGTPLNADAALKTLDLQRADLAIGLGVRPFVEVGDPFVKIDDLTFEIRLVDPWRYFPAFMAGLQFGMIGSPAWLDAALEDPTLNQEPVGTGPFVFERRTQDSVTRLSRNDDYWNGPVYLDAVEFHIVPDEETRATLLLEDGLDGMHTNDPAGVEALRAADGIRNALDDTGEEQFDVINTQAPPFDDIRARQALTHATPQDNYVTLLGAGQARRADQMFEPGSPYHNPDVVQETDRPDRAVELAAEYCGDNPGNCTDGRIDIVRQTSGPSVSQTREAELLAQGWRVAFNVRFEDLAEDDHIERVIFGRFQVADWRQFGAVDPSEDNVWLLCRTVSVLALNFPRVCDSERDELLLAAQIEEDPAVRAGMYQQVAALINQDHAYIFHLHTLWDIAYREGVRGACARTSPDGTPLRCQVNGRTFFEKVWLAD